VAFIKKRTQLRNAFFNQIAKRNIGQVERLRAREIEKSCDHL
jgi:hypothetical protein